MFVCCCGIGLLPSVLYVSAAAAAASSWSWCVWYAHVCSILSPSSAIAFLRLTLCGSLPGLGFPPPSRRGLVLWPMVTSISYVCGAQ